MRWLILLFGVPVFSILFACASDDHNGSKWPTVGVSVMVRNKAHSLPYFFSCLERLDYPKNRMYVWIWSDNNQDNSDDIIDLWVAKNTQKYHRVYVKQNDSRQNIVLPYTLIDSFDEDDTRPIFKDDISPTQWTEKRFRHMITLREDALLHAREKWADYHFMLDADVYLTNATILKDLISKNIPVVAPMLNSEGLYSNFWSAMSERHYFKKSKDYDKIREYEMVGCFDVPLVHTAVLVNMNHPKADLLTYDNRKLNDYDGPIDDIVIFAVSAMRAGVTQKICNDIKAGYVHVPLNPGDMLKQDIEQLINIKILALSEGNQLPLHPGLEHFVVYPKTSKFGLDEIYLINLERRQERRIYMEKCFKEIGMEVKFFKAFDGLTIDMEDLPYNIKLMMDYEDPYHGRPMKTGEIGCFLSHYKIWEEVARHNNMKVLILEDDVFFRPYFRMKMRRLMTDIEHLAWDLVYIGRKILDENEDRTSAYSVSPSYSYWTLGYLLSSVGARKLLAAKPLDKLLPVDEFLPIMFDKHPNDTWKSYFPKRNLVALSAHPLLVEPVRYVDQPGYISDTESSPIVDMAWDPYDYPDSVDDIDELSTHEELYRLKSHWSEQPLRTEF